MKFHFDPLNVFHNMRVHCFERSNHHLDLLSSFSMTGLENISFCIRAAFNPNLYYLVEARRKCHTVWDAIFVIGPDIKLSAIFCIIT